MLSNRSCSVVPADHRTRTRILGRVPMTARGVQMSAVGRAQEGKIGVLFVCLGNICRSPAAEAVFKSVVDRSGLADKFFIDSCGTGGGNADWYVDGGWSYHEGEAADSRMTQTARKRDVILTSRSRPLKPVDLSTFDYIIGMEAKNVRAVMTAAAYWSHKSKIPDDFQSRLHLMTDWCTKFQGVNAVPDPYYSGDQAFERVLDLLDDACEGLLTHILSEKKITV